MTLDTTDTQLLTVADVARRQRVTPKTVRRWIHAGFLEAFRPGGNRGPLRIRPSACARLLNARRVIAAVPGISRLAVADLEAVTR